MSNKDHSAPPQYITDTIVSVIPQLTEEQLLRNITYYSNQEKLARSAAKLDEADYDNPVEVAYSRAKLDEADEWARRYKEAYAVLDQRLGPAGWRYDKGINQYVQTH